MTRNKTKGTLKNFNTYMAMICIDPKRSHHSIAGEIKCDVKENENYTLPKKMVLSQRKSLKAGF